MPVQANVYADMLVCVYVCLSFKNHTLSGYIIYTILLLTFLS